MTWEDLKRQKEDSIRESTGNPMENDLKIGDKKYKSYSEYLESEEYQEFLKAEAESRKLYKQKAKEYFKSLDTDNQLLLFFHITNLIYENYYINKSSYRGLLYDKFQFPTDSYALGMDSGMFAIHNDIVIPEDKEAMLKLIIKYLDLDLDAQQLYNLRYIIHNLCLPNTKTKDIIYGQLAFDFD